MKLTMILLLLLHGFAATAQEDSSYLGHAPNRPSGDSKVIVTKTGLPGLPDITVTALRLGVITRDHTSGTINTYRKIHYTIKNEGKESVGLKNISMQGYMGADDVFIPENMNPACGAIANSGNGMLSAGASYTGWYNCTVGNNWQGMIYYLVWADNTKTITESKENNNTKVITIH